MHPFNSSMPTQPYTHANLDHAQRRTPNTRAQAPTKPVNPATPPSTGLQTRTTNLASNTIVAANGSTPTPKRPLSTISAGADFPNKVQKTARTDSPAAQIQRPNSPMERTESDYEIAQILAQGLFRQDGQAAEIKSLKEKIIESERQIKLNQTDSDEQKNIIKKLKIDNFALLKEFQKSNRRQEELDNEVDQLKKTIANLEQEKENSSQTIRHMGKKQCEFERKNQHLSEDLIQLKGQLNVTNSKNKDLSLENEVLLSRNQTLENGLQTIKGKLEAAHHEALHFEKELAKSQAQAQKNDKAHQQKYHTLENKIAHIAKEKMETEKALKAENMLLSNEIKELQIEKDREAKRADRRQLEMSLLCDQFEKLKSEFETLSKEKEEINQQNASLRHKSSKLKSKFVTVREKHRIQRNEHSKLNKDYHELVDKHDELVDEIEDLEEQNEKLLDKQARLKEEVNYLKNDNRDLVDTKKRLRKERNEALGRGDRYKNKCIKLEQELAEKDSASESYESYESSSSEEEYHKHKKARRS